MQETDGKDDKENQCSDQVMQKLNYNLMIKDSQKFSKQTDYNYR